MKKLLFIIYTLFCYAPNFAQIITTVAGGGLGDGAVATNASLYNPNCVAFDGSGNLFIADQNNNRIRKVAAGTGIISTVAGNGTQGFGGDGALAINANLNTPCSVAIDDLGNLFIADLINNRIRKVAANTGIISTVAGNGTQGFGGDGALAINAGLNRPRHVTIDGSGNLFIADCGNQRIRKVSAGTSIISTVAGNGIQGFGGDSSLATNARLKAPSGLAIDGSGNLFITDCGNSRIRKVDASTGIISTVAGNGLDYFAGDGGVATNACLKAPSSVAIDGSGNLFIADCGNNRIRKVDASTGIISTVAGNGYNSPNDGSAAVNAGLNSPSGLAIDGSGNFYIADYLNHRIRKVTVSTGIISTVAGNGTQVFAGDGALAINAGLYKPFGLAIDGSGNLYIADQYNNRVRKVAAGMGTISTVAGNGNPYYSGDGAAAINAGLYHPTGVAIDGSGNLIIADGGTRTIRKVNASTGIISTIAGNNTYGFSGDGALAINASLSIPFGIAIDGKGNIFIADYGNNRIRKIAASTGIISTVAGNGTQGFGGDGAAAINASLNYPAGVAVDGSGNLFIADYGNDRIRKVAMGTGIITTIAGNGTHGFGGDGALATNASLNNPYSVAIDSLGNLFIADTENNRIRKVTASTGIISTLAGNGTSIFAGDGADALNAGISGPIGVAIDSSGNLFIADIGNNRIRKVWFNVNNIITGNQTICVGTPADSLMGSLPLSGNGAYTYTWLKSITNVNSGFTAIPSSNSMSYKPTALTQSTWYKRYVVTGDYTDTSAAVLVAINNPITTNTFTSASQNICLGSSTAPIKASIPSGGDGLNYSYSWLRSTTNATSGFSAISSSNFQNYTPSTLTQNTWFKRIVSSGVCKADTSNAVAIIINPIPKPGFTINNPSQCLNGNSFTYSDTSKTALRLWTLANGNVDTNKVITNSIPSSGTYTIKLRVVSDKLCVDSISKNITVNPNPSIGTIQGATNVGMAVPYAYSIASQANHIYLWSATNGNIVSGQGTNAVQVQWLSAGTGKIQVQLTNNQNCSSSDSSVVSISNVGIKELHSLSQLELYPNPNNGDFKIKITISKASETRISLLNMLGQEVWTDIKTLSAGAQEIDLTTNVAAGVYILRLNNEDGQVQKSVVVR